MNVAAWSVAAVVAVAVNDGATAAGL